MQPLLENEIFEQAALLDYALAKTIKICPNQYTDPLRFLFTGDSLKIKNDLELVSRPHFFIEFLDKKLSFVILHKLAKFHNGTVFTSQVIQ